MRFFEEETQLVRRAASTRARALEILAPAELTEAIFERHRVDEWPWYRSVVYGLFGVVGVAVSLVVSGTASGQWVAGGIAAGLVYLGVILGLTRLELKLRPGLDVSFDRVTCEVGEYVSIVALNLHDRPQHVTDAVLTVEACPELWIEEGSVPTPPHTVQLQLPRAAPGFERHSLRPLQAVTWVWKAPAPGVYTVRFDTREHGPRVTRRMLRVFTTPAGAAPGAAAKGGAARAEGN